MNNFWIKERTIFWWKLALVLLFFVSINISDVYAQRRGYLHPTSKDVERAKLYYAQGNYQKCVLMADSIVPLKIDYYDAQILAYGILSSYNISSSSNAKEKILSTNISFIGSVVIDFYNDYLKNREINPYTSAERVAEFLNDVNLAITSWTCSSGSMGYYKRFDNFFGSQERKGDKSIENIIKTCYKKTFSLRHTWKDYPLIQVQILNQSLLYLFSQKKVDFVVKNDLFKEYWNDIDQLIAIKEATGNDAPVLVARGISQTIGKMLFEYWFSLKKEKQASLYAGLTLDFMLKQRDMTLFINGNKKYRDFKDVNWESIKNSLDDGEYAMETFVGANHGYYATWDFTTHTKNYAFIFNNKSDYPTLWSRGFVDLVEQNGFDAYKESYPDLKMLYTTSTDDMATKDIVGSVSYVSRVHSLSELITNKGRSDIRKSILMFADIDYYTITEGNTHVAKNKIIVGSEDLGHIAADSISVDCLKALFADEIKVFRGKNATLQAFFSYLPKANILHISTHGIFDDDAIELLNEQNVSGAITGSNVLESCKLALSGYNDDNRNCVAASEIKKLDLSNIELVFLDACQTNSGKALAGGTYSLAESFHMAGVKKIIANIDPIDSDIATAFVRGFYEKIKKGQSYHDAFYETKATVCPKQRIIFWE